MTGVRSPHTAGSPTGMATLGKRVMRPYDAPLSCIVDRVRKAVGHSIPDYLYDPPKLAGFCNGHLPCPRSEILSADRSILCHEIWLTTWLEVDCHEVRTRLSDNNPVE